MDFTSLIGIAICEVLFVFSSYLNDDTETVIFEHIVTVLFAIIVYYLT